MALRYEYRVVYMQCSAVKKLHRFQSVVGGRAFAFRSGVLRQICFRVEDMISIFCTSYKKLSRCIYDFNRSSRPPAVTSDAIPAETDANPRAVSVSRPV